MTDNYLMIDVNDPRSDRIAEAISNKTSKKIINLLAEKDMSASDIAERLSIPLNTAGYNLDKLVEAGLIEKTKAYFWSVKGKKIASYRLSNKKIVISPRRMMRGIIPALIGIGAIAFGLKIWEDNNVVSKVAETVTDQAPSFANKAGEVMAGATGSAGSAAGGVATSAAPNIANVPSAPSSGIIGSLSGISNAWAWFLLGALVALVIYLSFNLKRSGKI